MRATIVIPVLNEAERLRACLDAVAAQDLPAELVEVLVVDGGSTDATVDVARAAFAERGWGRAEVLHSAVGDRSSNLNVGLWAASGKVLVRVDARSRIPRHYVRRCLELLGASANVAVVGGRQRAVAPGTGALGTGVARALNNRWTMGLSRYRRGAASGETDTVYLGAYRTAELRAVGGWRADLTVNEDYDLNRRLSRFGKVWFDAGLTVDYVPRASLRALLGQYWAFGTGKARYWRVSGDRPQRRQVLILAAPVLAGGAVTALWVGAGVAPLWPFVLVLGAGAALEIAGSDGPDGGPLAHAAALAAMACVGGGWLAGVAAGMARPLTTTSEVVPVGR